MSSIDYETIYKRALVRIDDLKLLNYSKEDFYDFMSELLKSCMSVPKLRKLFSSFSFDDEIESLEFNLSNSVDESYDIQFVTNILAKGIIINYLPSRLESTVHLATMIGGTEEKKLVDNYKTNIERLKNLEKEFDLEISQHSYYFGNNGV